MVRLNGRIAMMYAAEKGIEYLRKQKKARIIEDRFDEVGMKLQKLDKKTMKEDQPFGVKKTMIKVSTGLKPLQRVVKGSITYRDAYDTTLDWTTNYSQFRIITYVGAKRQYMDADVTSVQRADRSYADWFGLNPLSGLPVSKNVTATTAETAPAQDWLGCRTSTLYYDIANLSSATAFLKIHVFVADDNTENDILSLYDKAAQSGLYNTTYATPTSGQVPVNGGKEKLINPVSATDSIYCNAYALPYTNLLSKRNIKPWRKLKTTSITLCQGDMHQHIVNIDMNQFGIREKLSNQTTDFSKGIVAVIFEAQGAAVQNAANNGITYAAGKIGIVCTRKVRLCPLQAPNARFENTYVGKGTVTGAAANATTKSFMDGDYGSYMNYEI